MHKSYILHGINENDQLLNFVNSFFFYKICDSIMIIFKDKSKKWSEDLLLLRKWEIDSRVNRILILFFTRRAKLEINFTESDSLKTFLKLKIILPLLKSFKRGNARNSFRSFEIRLKDHKIQIFKIFWFGTLMYNDKPFLCSFPFIMCFPFLLLDWGGKLYNSGQ